MDDVKEKTAALLQRLVSFGLDVAEMTGNKVTMNLYLTIEPVTADDAEEDAEGDGDG